MRKFEYTADDEFPDCGKCDNINAPYKICAACGAEHCWNRYIRTEYINDESAENYSEGYDFEPIYC